MKKWEEEGVGGEAKREAEGDGESKPVGGETGCGAVLISGPSGSGKTFLLRHMKRGLEKDEGLKVTSVFDLRGLESLTEELSQGEGSLQSVFLLDNLDILCKTSFAL